ncbi:hypothetical protein CDAR_609451 [Caerostris darwini]|uniref:Cytochrome c biogenesis B n=1 Tax=Caerostris darwini TaxID=1538125 RepID=A0AAV4VYW6_9ARAC|nr:hypothetical protein CDAR_609451 [Caerostris darwini]
MRILPSMRSLLLANGMDGISLEQRRIFLNPSLSLFSRIDPVLISSSLRLRRCVISISMAISCSFSSLKPPPAIRVMGIFCCLQVFLSALSFGYGRDPPYPPPCTIHHCCVSWISIFHSGGMVCTDFLCTVSFLLVRVLVNRCLDGFNLLEVF